MVTTDGTQLTVKGIGAHICGTSDQFEFVYQHCVGDCTIIARVTSLPEYGSVGQGRRDAAGNARRQVAAGGRDRLAVEREAMEYRSATGGTSASAGTATGAAPGWVRLVRRGNVITGSWSTDGSNFVQVGSLTMPMNPTIFAGLAVTSHNTTAATNAIFNAVTFEQP